MKNETRNEGWYGRFLHWAGGEEPDGPEGPERSPQRTGLRSGGRSGGPPEDGGPGRCGGSCASTGD